MKFEPRIKKPWITLATLAVKLRDAQETGASEISLPVHSAQEILDYYGQAQKAAEFVAQSTLFTLHPNEHPC